MNHFELFEIPVTLLPDLQLLKQKFYQLSRRYHPDFYTQEGETEQAEALEKSSQVNKAFKTFQNRDETIKYVLQLKGLLEEEEKYQLPPDFLMDMLELNEQVADAKMDGDTASVTRLQQAVATVEAEIYAPVKMIVENYADSSATTAALLQVKDYYYKKKYLNRILAAIA